jgi:hypothetical protein
MHDFGLVTVKHRMIKRKHLLSLSLEVQGLVISCLSHTSQYLLGRESEAAKHWRAAIAAGPESESESASERESESESESESGSDGESEREGESESERVCVRERAAIAAGPLLSFFLITLEPSVG